jgi:hypothetical protein
MSPCAAARSSDAMSATSASGLTLPTGALPEHPTSADPTSTQAKTNPKDLNVFSPYGYPGSDRNRTDRLARFEVLIDRLSRGLLGPRRFRWERC